MKVVLISRYWKESPGGGIKVFLTNLFDTLKQNGCDMSVIFLEGNDPTQFKARPGKITFAISAYRQLCRLRPDVVHAHSAWFTLLPGVLYQKLYGCSLVYTFHTEPVQPLSFPARMVFKTLLANCDHVTFVSKRFQERTFEIDRLTFPNSTITYAGAVTQTVSDEDIEQFKIKYGIRDDAVVLLASGMTALPYKAEGLKVLLCALIQLRNIFPTIVLIATREGRYYHELKTFAADNGIEDRVIFTGDIDNPFVPLSLCDIYTHITFAEGGVSIALIEAMSMGKSIVAASVGGIPEAIDDGVNGLLVDPDPSAVAEKIGYLLQNPEIGQTLGHNARLKAEEFFTWDRSAKTFMSLYANNFGDRA